MLDFVVGAVTTPIRIAIMFAILFLAVLILSLPSLLGRGVAALGKGFVTLLVPTRRAAWLRGRRAARERKRKMHEGLALLGREIAEYGKEEASRRHAARLQAELDARREARRAARETTDPS